MRVNIKIFAEVIFLTLSINIPRLCPLTLEPGDGVPGVAGSAGHHLGPGLAGVAPPAALRPQLALIGVGHPVRPAHRPEYPLAELAI